MDALDGLRDDEIAGLMLKIEQGTWPENPLIPVGKPFENKSGKIWNLVWGKFGSGTAIQSEAGAVRSNHFHMTDTHFIYVVSGLMYYYWRPAQPKAETPKRVRCPAGSLVFTPPMVEHATYFPKETFVVTFNSRARDHKSHESDLVRVDPFVTSEQCPSVLYGHRCVLPYQFVEKRDFRHPIHDGEHEDIDGSTFAFQNFPG